MVNSRDRLDALKVLREYSSGRLTNRQVEEAYPTDSRDQAVNAVYSQLWLSWSDSSEHAFDPSLHSGRELLDTFRRCELFLGSELTYEWPRGARLGSWLQLACRTLRLERLAELVAASEVRRAKRLGDWDVWPFFRRSDLERASSAQDRAEIR